MRQRNVSKWKIEGQQIEGQKNFLLVPLLSKDRWNSNIAVEQSRKKKKALKKINSMTDLKETIAQLFEPEPTLRFLKICWGHALACQNIPWAFFKPELFTNKNYMKQYFLRAI